MYPNNYADAEIAYRRARLAEAFRAGATRHAGVRRQHHVSLRKHDRRS